MTVLVLGALATFRLSWLIAFDDIADPFRGWVFHAGVKARRRGYRTLRFWLWLDLLINCPWCVSAWVGAALALTGSWWADSRWWLIPCTALAFSAVAGLLSNLAVALATSGDDT